MFISIYENSNGVNHVLRRIAPNESLDCRAYVRQWAEREYGDYGPKLSFSETGSHIHNGCGDYQAEIRETEEPNGVCWESEPFFLELTETD